MLSISRSEGEVEVDISADFWTCAVCEGTPVDILGKVLEGRERGDV